MRGVVSALVATFVAVFSHSIADGSVPSAVGIILALAFAVPTCVFLTGRSLSRIRLAVSVLSSQFVFHAAMTLGNYSTTTVADTATVGGHEHGTSSVMLDLAGSTAHTSHDSFMWLAHLTAAALTILALRQGEQAFWAIIGHTGFAIVRALSAFVVGWSPYPRPIRPRVSLRRRLPRLIVLSVMRHRGPPVVAA